MAPRLKDDGTWLNLELLRTAAWVEENWRDGKVYVFLEELGIDGWAEVLSESPCPQIAERPHPDCRLLTGRFIHQAANAFNLTVVDEVSGNTKTIGVTGNHPVWCEDRQDFVRVDTRAIGEHLRDTRESLLRVRSIEPRAGPEKVYNLEVDVEHVYFVSAAGLLVHNATPEYDSPDPKNAKGISNVPGDDFVPNSSVSTPYSRPRGAGPTAAQRRAVQGMPCVECGQVTAKQIPDHIDPLVVQHYREGAVDTAKQSQVDAVQPHCPDCSAKQGGY